MTTQYWQHRLFELHNKIKDKEDIGIEIDSALSEFKRTLKNNQDFVAPQRDFDYDFSKDNSTGVGDVLNRVDEAIMIGLSLLDK